MLLGYEQEGMKLISANESDFEKALQVELNNITLPGEGEKAHQLQDFFMQYKSTIKDATDASLPADVRRTNYFTKLLPLFEQIKTTADDILQMNQQNMGDANDHARRRAASARKQMYFLLVVGAVVAGGFIFFTGRWILRPITRLILSANEIRAGNLDLVVKTDSRDEIGQLSEAFNSMAESLRRVRRTREAKLAQIQHATQQAFNTLPDAVAVVDLDGRVEVATEAAVSAFGLKPNTQIQGLSLDWILPLFNTALRTALRSNQVGADLRSNALSTEKSATFVPRAVPILDRERQATAVMFILSDVTQQAPAG